MHAFAEAWPDRGIVQQLAAQIPWGTVTSVKALTSVHCSLISDHQSPAPSALFPSSARGIHKRAEIRSDLKKENTKTGTRGLRRN